MSKGGGGACACPRVGAFFKLMTSRGQCPRGVVLVNVFTPPPSGNPVAAPGVPPIQVQTPPPPTWMAGYGPAGLHLPLLAGWGGNDKLAIDKGGNLPEKVENHWYRQIA